MTLQRAQIDVLLQDLEATAWRRHREDPRDPNLSRDIVERARALLRVAAPDEHLRICDHAQHLLLSLDGDAAPDGHASHVPAAVAAAVDDGIQHAVRPTREHVPDLGIPLVDDPFDLDAYLPPEPEPSLAPVTMLPAPQAVRVLSPGGAGERRGGGAGPDERELRRGLTPQQLQTLDTMSHFGWKLCFVRRPLFLPPVPVAFDRNRERFVVVEADGSIDDAPRLALRD